MSADIPPHRALHVPSGAVPAQMRQHLVQQVTVQRKGMRGVHLLKGDGQDKTIGSDAAAGSDEMHSSAVTSRDGSQRKEVDRLNALLEASEVRGDAAQEEADRLRAENESLNAAVDRSTRLLSNLRAEYDRLREEVTAKQEQSPAPTAETVRLRSQLAEVDRELQRVSSYGEQTARELVVEKKRAATLERVCMELRRRVAIAEDKAQDEKKVQDALLAREVAEAQLAEVKVEAERWRARSSVADVARERAEAAERSERLQRDKVAVLERELESREALLRQGGRERKKLKEYMLHYEQELEEKESKLCRLRAWAKEHGFEKGGSVHVRMRRRRGANWGPGSEDDSAQQDSTSLSVEKDFTAQDDEILGQWNEDMTTQSSNSLPSTTKVPGVSVSLAEASPFLREVEEAHAQLENVFKDADAEKARHVGEDLAERVRRLEASLSALSNTRSLASQ